MYRSHEENDLSTVSARKVTIAKAKVDLAEVEKKKAALAKMFPNTDIRVGSDATLDIPGFLPAPLWLILLLVAAYPLAVSPRFSAHIPAVRPHSRSPVSLTYKSRVALRSSLTWSHH